jgi:hypothetical protein
MVSAHQPRLVSVTPTVVIDPEISKAYYGELSGSPHIFTIHATTTFALYVNVLVPDIDGQKKDISAAIIKEGDLAHPVAILDGADFDWKKFDEPFGHDTYWAGPEYRAVAGAGDYDILVWSSNNDSKYSLAVGEIESFDLAETVNTLAIIPGLKTSFFMKSPADFILSPIGVGYVVVMFLLAAVAGFIYRLVLKRFATGSVRRAPKNIGRTDRLIRAALGLALFALAILTTWSPLLLFLAGFCFFEAIFSWCGLYAALGKNSCPT